MAPSVVLLVVEQFEDLLDLAEGFVDGAEGVVVVGGDVGPGVAGVVVAVELAEDPTLRIGQAAAVNSAAVSWVARWPTSSLPLIRASACPVARHRAAWASSWKKTAGSWEPSGSRRGRRRRGGRGVGAGYRS